jgi:hypothetical protein
MSESIKIDPSSEFSFVINATLAEWEEHIVAFLESKDLILTSLENENVVKGLIRQPLLLLWAELTEKRQLELKRALQYLLVHDKEMPYKIYAHNKDLQSKEGGLAQKIRDSCQDTLSPFDGYSLCIWMWEILFGHEDWNVDISQWILIDKSM